MIARTVKIQLVVFLLISVLGVAYAGFTYVGIRSFFGFHFARAPYVVKVDLADSGGIFTNAQVTERGLSVGTVGKLSLLGDGVQVQLKIDPGTKIPADVTAQVANLSAVGEQYVDLTPQADGAPYLTTDGKAEISRDRTSIPVDDATLLLNLDKTVKSVNNAHLRTVIDELGTAFDGTGPNLQRLIDKGNLLLSSAQAALPQTLALIDDGKTVLNTQRDLSGDLRSFSKNLNLLSQQLVTSDPDVRALFDNGDSAAKTLQGIIQDNSANLGSLTANLLTLGKIQQARLPGTEDLLILYPGVVTDGFLGARGGVAHFGAVTTTAPPDCASGYQSTKHRAENPNNSRYGIGGPANLNTSCEAPDSAKSGGSGTSDGRGAGTAPRPSGDNTGVRGGAIGTTTSSTSPHYSTAKTDRNGNATVNGTQYQMGSDAQQSMIFGSDAWQYLLAANAAS